MAKNILIIVTKGEIGGAQMMVVSLAMMLKKAGHNVTVGVGPEGNFVPEKLMSNNVKVKIFNSLKRSYAPTAIIRFWIELRKFLTLNKFDAVHLNSSNAIVAGLITKTIPHPPKVIFTFHGLSYLDPDSKSKALVKIIFYLFYKFFGLFVDCPVFVCQINRDYAQKIKLVKNGMIIYNGAAPDFINQTEARDLLEKKCGADLKNKFVIGSVGRLAYPKNYEFAIETFPEILKIIPSARLVIVGNGPERDKYEKIIETLKLKDFVYLPGALPGHNSPLLGFDLFVLPSKYEGMSVTILEALAAKLPILASRVGGNPEILDSEFMYELDNQKEFLEKIKNLYLTKHAPENNKFNLKNTLEGYLNLYK